MDVSMRLGFSQIYICKKLSLFVMFFYMNATIFRKILE